MRHTNYRFLRHYFQDMISSNTRSAKRKWTRSASKGEVSETAAKRTKSRVAIAKEERIFNVLACGSFNPITSMHLRLFEVAKNCLESRFPDCRVARGIISPVSDGYRKKGLESSNHRIKMCSLAVKDNTWLSVSTWEGNKKEWTPTVEVLQNTRKMLEKEQGPKFELVLLCGADILDSFNTPGLWKLKDIDKILSDFGLVVVHRPGSDPESIVRKNPFLHAHKENIHVVKDAIVNDLSSTSVRTLLREKKSIKYLTPDLVIRYILDNKLYISEESANRNSDLVLAPFQVNKNLQ